MGILENLIVFPRDFDRFKEQIGKKTLNLKQLVDLDYRVPGYLAIPSSVCTRIFQDSGKILLDQICRQIREEAPYSLYAVRSSALIEDSSEKSLAGQFHTEIEVAPDQLASAIMTVLKQAHHFLDGQLGQFSILIQQYIIPDYAGVAFTRDPLGNREIVLEYHRGRGEELVSGKIKPERLKFLPGNVPAVSALPDLKNIARKFREIEKHFGFAQDIEWCLKNGTWYFLQTRPVTTISVSQYEQCLYLDQILPAGENYYYEKTEISEIAPAPTPFTWSLLEKIYAPNGPVSQVYQKYGVHYAGKSFLLKIGNELLVDRERELANYLPSYSYFSGKQLQPRLARLSGIFKTIGNILALNRISLQNDTLSKTIKEALEQPAEKSPDFTELLQLFMNNYQLIFEANLLADKALKNLTLAVKNEPIGIADLLGARPPFNYEPPPVPVLPDSSWTGNALEIANEENFTVFSPAIHGSKTVDSWWRDLPAWKQTWLKPVISQALYFTKIREYGRWLTVKGINQLRREILEQARQAGFKTPRDAYFAEIEELLTGNFSEKNCRPRKIIFEKQSQFHFPSRLTNICHEEKKQLQGVSAGVAGGQLVTLDQLDAPGDKILYTKTLTPDLTAYFDQIKGIVSEEGGLLSHLAIMARENKLPVIVGFSLSDSKIKIGDRLRIDGNTGTISNG